MHAAAAAAQRVGKATSPQARAELAPAGLAPPSLSPSQSPPKWDASAPGVNEARTLPPAFGRRCAAPAAFAQRSPERVLRPTESFAQFLKLRTARPVDVAETRAKQRRRFEEMWLDRDSTLQARRFSGRLQLRVRVPYDTPALGDPDVYVTTKQYFNPLLENPDILEKKARHQRLLRRMHHQRALEEQVVERLQQELRDAREKDARRVAFKREQREKYIASLKSDAAMVREAGSLARTW